MVLPAMSCASQAQDSLLVNLITEYFAEQLTIDPYDISVSLIRTPNLSAAEMKVDTYRMESGYRKTKLGRQTLWLIRESGNRLVKRYPVTADIYANLFIPVTAKRIKRSNIIGQYDIKLERRKIGRNIDQIIRTEASTWGLQATQMIPAGSVIKYSMLRDKPDVMSGEPVDVLLKKGALSVILEGVAKEDGAIGEAIRIQCTGVNKELRGVLSPGKKVSISLK